MPAPDQVTPVAPPPPPGRVARRSGDLPETGEATDLSPGWELVAYAAIATGYLVGFGCEVRSMWRRRKR